MDVNSSGNVYVADSGNLRRGKISLVGGVATVAASGISATNHLPGLLTQSRTLVAGLKCFGLDTLGHRFVLDANRMRRMAPEETVSNRV